MLFQAMTCIGHLAFSVLHFKPINLDAGLDIVSLFIIINKQPSFL